MGKNQGKKQVIVIRFFFCILCVFSLLGMYSSYYVSTSSFSDTERITATFLMGSGICTYRAGYWSHHPECWPVEILTIGGVSHTNVEVIEIMQIPGEGDKTYDLFRELAATMLNLLCGCTPDCIQETVMQADAWFVLHPVGSGVHASDPAWKLAKPWWKLLEQYNKGLLCEESCNNPPDIPCTLSPEPLYHGTAPRLVVYVHDEDSDVLTVTFYTATNDRIIGECSEVESDSIVALPIDTLDTNKSFGWYVIVQDQHAVIRSPTWWFTMNTNETEPMSEDRASNTSVSPDDPFGLIDLSPSLADANATYTFQALLQNHSEIQEVMVHYWYDETIQVDLMLCLNDGVWGASMLVASDAPCFWYRLYGNDGTGVWNAGEEQIVAITSDGGGI